MTPEYVEVAPHVLKDLESRVGRATFLLKGINLLHTI